MTLFVLKLTVVLLLGCTIAALLRTRSAAARHLVWALTLAGALLLPVATRFAPAMRVTVPEWKQEVPVTNAAPVTFAPRNAAVPAADPAASTPPGRRDGAQPAGRRRSFMKQASRRCCSGSPLASSPSGASPVARSR